MENVRLQSSRPQSPGFTLVEMLVAVGAVALVSVGLAAIFQTVGRTVTTGKRISALTQQAAILETQMREDFERMTRDGFLVIRHQFTIDGASNSVVYPKTVATLRYKGDPLPARPRRIDELLFFANGDFRTQREDMIPGRTARSREARIYYGHGQQGVVLDHSNSPNADQTYSYYYPEFDDRFWYNVRNGGAGTAEDLPKTAQNRLGGKVPPGITATTGGYSDLGINYYASDWTLVRQATLLIRPTSSSTGGWPSDRPVPVAIGNDPWMTGGKSTLTQLTSDSQNQVAGQPAASSIFRCFSEMLTLTFTNGLDDNPRRYAMFWPSNKNFNRPGITPRFNSGTVDIATTDLSEVALVINGTKVEPGSALRGENFFTSRTQGNDLGMLAPTLPLIEGALYPSLEKGFRRYFESQKTVVGLGSQGERVGAMQAWMLSAMPAPSGFMPTSATVDSANIGQSTAETQRGRVGARIRYEPKTPDLRGLIDFTTVSANPPSRDAAIARGNAMSVGLTGIAPHCTEFIVEWSWGQTYPLNSNSKDEFGNDVGGQTIWYGRTLGGYTGTTAKIVQNLGQPPSPDIYQYDPNASYSAIVGSSVSPGGTTKLSAPTPSPVYQPFVGDTNKSSNVQNYKVNDWLIHGICKRTTSVTGDQSSLVSYFGYFDPSFTPQANTDDPSSMAWPWPKMIRVTYTLADPNDPSIEQTFQCVFNVPSTPKP